MLLPNPDKPVEVQRIAFISAFSESVEGSRGRLGRPPKFPSMSEAAFNPGTRHLIENFQLNWFIALTAEILKNKIPENSALTDGFSNHYPL
jgi:hypothetical protein